MAKDALYFSHDSNARNDRKNKALINRYGMAGYGQFWVIVETLRDEDEYRLPLDALTFSAFSQEFSLDESEVKQFIEDCIEMFFLFQSDGQFFWSNSLIERMKKKELVSEGRRKAALKRWGEPDAKSVQNNAVNQPVNANAMQNYTNAMQNDANKERKKGNKEIKGSKESFAVVENFKNQLLEDQTFINETCMVNKIKPEKLKNLLDQFILGKKALSHEWKNFSDFKTNFFYWIPKRLNGEIREPPNLTPLAKFKKENPHCFDGKEPIDQGHGFRILEGVRVPIIKPESAKIND